MNKFWIITLVCLGLSTLPVFADEHDHLYAGIPVENKDSLNLQVFEYEGFMSGYDNNKKNPAWVAYRLFSNPNYSKSDRPDSNAWSTEYRTTAKVTKDAYKGSGYDRGHMAPNHGIMKCYGPSAQLGTFIMTNSVPQKPMLNRIGHKWQVLEHVEADRWAEKFKELFVIDGPIYEGTEKQIEREGVAIPSHCYKIIVSEDQDGVLHAIAFIFSQRVTAKVKPALKENTKAENVEKAEKWMKENFQEHIVSIDEIEEKTGLDFFADLPDDLENELESKKARQLWTFAD